MRKIVLDSRDLEHPKPLEKAIDILRHIDKDSYLYMLNRKNPIPLISLAEQHGFAIHSDQIHDDEWHILITKDKNIELDNLLEVDTDV